ncbi:type 2 isopentenyl-diphosphate Delta-isomerase, partial [Bacillus subtilis]
MNEQERAGERLLPEVATGERKLEHVRLCLEENVAGEGVTSGMERYAFRHNPLPELNFDEVSMDTFFMGKNVRTPLLI